MKRLLVLLTALAWLWAAPVVAGPNLLPLMGVGGPSGATYTGPGDIVSGAVDWYGVRAYNAANAATPVAAVNIRRASDNHTCDIKTASSGGLATTTSNCSTGGDNGSTVSSWCNATTCLVAVWYDQGSGANNLIQATAADEPVFVQSCVNSLPCAQFNAATPLWMATASNAFTQSQPITASFVGIRTGNFSANNEYFRIGSAGLYSRINNSANLADIYAGSDLTATASDSAWHAFQNVFNGASSTINVDNTLTNGAAGANGASSLFIAVGATQGAGEPLTGEITEIGFWAVGFNTTQQTNMCHNEYAYWGTATAC